MRKKKILIIANTIEGGTGTFLKGLSSLDSYSINICLVSGFKVREKYVKYKFRSEPRDKTDYTYNPVKYLNLIKEIAWIKRIIKEENPDVIVTLDIHACLLGIFGRGIFTPIKDRYIISTIHNNVRFIFKEKIPFLFRFPLRLFCLMLFKRVDRFICVSKLLADDFSDYFHQKNVQVIPNGISIPKKYIGEKLSKSDMNLFDKKNFTIISVGRFEKQKDFPTLLAAFGKVKKKIPNVRLLLLGIGSQEKMLKKIARELYVADDVYFLGWKTNIFPYLKRASLFVLSSNYEGFGYVLLEAMSQGVPVISTSASFGPSEILENGKYGVLVPISSPKEMAKGINELITNKSLRMKYAGLGKRRIQDFTLERMINSYRSILDECLGLIKS